MPQIGPMEIFMLAAIALIVFGPQKLPEIARSVGRFMSEMRRMASEVRSEFTVGLDDEDVEPTAVVEDEDSAAIDDAATPPGSEER